MRYTVYLEIQADGTTMAHVPALPGCVSTGVTKEVALARTPDAIAAYIAWLRSHGEPVAAEDDPVEIELGGTIQEADPHLGDEPGLLPTDRGALSEEELAGLIRLMDYSRQDLVNQITGLSRELLHWEPPAPIDNAGWTIDDILEHLIRAERVYASRLNSNIFAMLAEARRQTMERLARLTDQELAQVTEQQGEYWTARKVVRRLLEHEREHYLHINQVLRQFEAEQGLRPQ